jgi:hypothetical protein
VINTASEAEGLGEARWHVNQVTFSSFFLGSLCSWGSIGLPGAVSVS